MNLFYDLFGLGEIGGIGCIAFHLHAESGNFLFGLLSVFVDYEIGEGDVGAFTGKTQGNLLADAAGGAGDDCSFSFK